MFSNTCTTFSLFLAWMWSGRDVVYCDFMIRNLFERFEKFTISSTAQDIIIFLSINREQSIIYLPFMWIEIDAIVQWKIDSLIEEQKGPKCTSWTQFTFPYLYVCFVYCLLSFCPQTIEPDKSGWMCSQQIRAIFTCKLKSWLNQYCLLQTTKYICHMA